MKSRWQIHIIVLLLFLVIATIQIFPLLGKFTTGIPYTHAPVPGTEVSEIGPADALQLYYKFWLFKDSIIGRTPLLSDNYKFSIEENHKQFSLQLFPLSLLFLLFSFGGGAFAYNMTIVATSVLAGFSAYLLAAYLTRKQAAGVIAGLVFMLIPFKYAQTLGGHPNGFLFFLVPLGLYFFERGYRESRISYGIYSGLCLLALGLTEFHIIYYSAIFYGLYVPFRFIFPSGKGALYRKRLNRMLRTVVPMIICLSIFGLYILVKQHTMIKKSVAGEGRSYKEILLYSPRIRDITDRFHENAEKYLYPGMLAAAMAVTAFLLSLLPSSRKGAKPNQKEQRSIAIFMAGTLAFSLILALGPNGDRRFFGIYKFLYKNLPFFNYPRVPGRIFILTITALATLVGFAVARVGDYLHRTISRRSTRLVISTILLIIVFAGISADYLIKQKIGIVLFNEDNQAYRIVRKNIGREKLLEIPIWPGEQSWSAIYLYYITLTRAHIINGYSPVVKKSYVENIYEPLVTLNTGEITEKQYRMLKNLHVKYIMLHEEGFPPRAGRYPALVTFENFNRSPYVRFVAQDQPVYLFELLDQPREVQKKRLSSIVGRWYDESQPRQETIGEIVKDERALGGKAVCAHEGDTVGFSVWSYPSGQYRALFRLRAEPDTAQELLAKLVIKQGRRVVAEKEIKAENFVITGDYSDFELEYEIDVAGIKEGMSFQVQYFGRRRLWLDYVYILFADQHDRQEIAFEAEQMFHIGKTVYDEKASDGKAVRVTLTDPSGNIVFGLSRRFPAGRYQVSYRIALEGEPGRQLCSAQAIRQIDRYILDSAPVKVESSTQEGEWKDVVLNFSIDRPQIIDFPVHFYKNGTVTVDRIEVRKTADEH